MGLFNPHNAVLNSVIIYIILIMSIVILKPEFIYNKDTGKFKKFGNKENQTYFTFPIIAVISSIIIYSIFSLIENSSYDYDIIKLRNYNYNYRFR